MQLLVYNLILHIFKAVLSIFKTSDSSWSHIALFQINSMGFQEEIII